MIASRASGPAVFLALSVMSGCSSGNQADAQDSKNVVTLANGVEVPILPGVKLQPVCEAFGQKLPDAPGNVCLEFPRALALAGKGQDIQNQYAKLLTGRGFTWGGGASIQYWLRWPLANGCSQRFTLSTLPKAKIEGDDWTIAETFVLVMGFEPPECESKP